MMKKLNKEILPGKTKLGVSKDIFVDLFEHAPVGYFQLERNGTILNVNMTGSSLLGMEQSQLVGKYFEQYVHEEYRDIFRDFLRKLFNGSLLGQNTELVLLKASKEPLWVFIEATVAADNHRCRIVVETSHPDHGNRFQQIIELTPNMIAISEGDRIQFINRSGVKLLGVNNSNGVIGKSFMEFIHPSQWAEIKLKINKLMGTSGAILGSEMSFLRRDGTQVDIEFSVTPMSGEEPNHFQIIAQDITARKQQQAILQREAVLVDIEQGFFQFLELPIILDRIVQLVFSIIDNNGGVSIFMWNQDDHKFSLERTWSNIPGQAEIDRFLCAKDSICYQIINDRIPLKVSDVDADTSDFGNLLHIANIHAYAGVPLRVEDECMGVLFVLSKQGNLYFQENFDLILAIANRAALAIGRAKLYERLQKAKETAEDAAKTKTLILAKSSHELRSPLARIIYLIEILRGTDLSPEQSEYLNRINSAAEKLLNLIDDILDFSKIEASKLKLEPRTFDLRECIEECLNLNYAQAEKKGLSLAYWVDASIPQFVVGDPNRIEQVLINLITNSLKFTQSGYVFLNISRSEQVKNQQIDTSSNASNLLFSVKDTGIGIPLNRQKILFKAFSQINDSVNEIHDGSGLGLAICKQLVDTMGGDIWASSSGVPGEGSVFTFTLPIQIIPGEPSVGHLIKDQVPLKDHRVLVVSNNKANRLMFSNWLSFWGMRVETCEATDDSDQVDMIERNELAILDLHDLHANTRLYSEALPIKYTSQPNSIIAYGSQSNTLQFGMNFPKTACLKTPFKVESLYLMLRELYAKTPTSQVSSRNILSTPTEQDINILVAEDDPTLAKALTMQLSNWGYTFEVVKDGYQVLHAVQQKIYQVILIDLFMPGMDGLEATRRIREMLPSEQQPFIMMLTADTQLAKQEEIVAAGVNRVLVKPIKGDVLKKALTQISEQSNISINHFSTSLEEPQALSTQNVIDEDMLDDFHRALGLDSKQALSELIISYLGNAPKLLEDMNNALNKVDWEQLKWSAHALKGNSELFGARNLSNMCQQLIEDITRNFIDNIVIQIKNINYEYKRVCEVLQSKL